MIVDDEEPMRLFVKTALEYSGYDVTGAADAAALRRAYGGPQPEVVLLDLRLPDADGLMMLPELKKKWPDTEVIMLTGYGTYDAAIEATKRGAYYFQVKPFEVATLKLQIERALEHKHLNEETSLLRRALSATSEGGSPIFQSPAMKEVVRRVERFASSNASVLITGESGTGKEVIADLLHTLSPRKQGPNVKVNCAALPHDLVESELFGFIKNSFTGAKENRPGLFRKADGGTLLLDELSEMPIDMQSKLLRVLQEKVVRPVGSNESCKVDCRVIASTNRDPAEAIRQGKLREDLFYRISTIKIVLPPLRERREDILPLANSFLKHYAAEANVVITGFSVPASEMLGQFDWPGNVRQLQSEVQHAVLVADGTVIEVSDLSINDSRIEPSGHDSASAHLTVMEATERRTIMETLKAMHGNKLKAAKYLGIGRQTLYNKIHDYGIPE